MNTRTEKFWKAVGGRKQINGYLYAALLTVMVFVLDGTFDAYAMWLGAALLGTSAIVAAEDKKGSRPFPRRRSSDVRPTVDTDIPEAS